MIDLSWVEISFCAVLALIVIGPKDLPKLFTLAGQLWGKIRRLYAQFQGGMRQLQQEVNIDKGDVSDPDEWRKLLPDDVRFLPDDFVPGSMTAEQHQKRAVKLGDAKPSIVKNKAQQDDKADCK